MIKNKIIIVFTGLINNFNGNIIYDNLENNSLLIDFDNYNKDLLNDKENLTKLIEEYLYNLDDDVIYLNFINQIGLSKYLFKILENIKEKFRKQNNSIKLETIYKDYYSMNSIYEFNKEKLINYFDKGIYLPNLFTNGKIDIDNVKIKNLTKHIEYYNVGNGKKDKTSNINKEIIILGNRLKRFITEINYIKENLDNDNVLLEVKEILNRNIFNNEFFSNLKDFKQTSKNHLETLGHHITLIIGKIVSDYNFGKINQETKEILIIIALFHDIGKIYTRKVKYLDKEKNIEKYMDQDLENNNDIEFIKNILKEKRYTFYEHDNVSAYIVKNQLGHIIDNELNYDLELITNVIYYHITAHNIIQNILEEKKKKKYKILGKTFNIKELLEIFNFVKKNGISIKGVSDKYSSEELTFFRLLFLFEEYDSSGKIKYIEN